MLVSNYDILIVIIGHLELSHMPCRYFVAKNPIYLLCSADLHRSKFDTRRATMRDQIALFAGESLNFGNIGADPIYR
jgi:hypothetical protein